MYDSNSPDVPSLSRVEVGVFLSLAFPLLLTFAYLIAWTIQTTGSPVLVIVEGGIYLCLALLASLVLHPYVLAFRDEPEPLDEPTQNTVDTICQRLEMDLRGGCSLSMLPRDSVVMVGGLLQSNLHVLVSRATFQRLPKSEREAVVAVVAARARHWFDLYVFALPLVLFALYLSAYAFESYRFEPGELGVLLDYLPELLLFAGVALLAIQSRRITYAADRTAAEATSPGAVADAIETIEREIRDDDLEWGFLQTVVAVHPSPRKRIDRLREWSDWAIEESCWQSETEDRDKD